MAVPNGESVRVLAHEGFGAVVSVVVVCWWGGSVVEGVSVVPTVAVWVRKLVWVTVVVVASIVVVASVAYVVEVAYNWSRLA